jgi:hypothetical protein
MLIYGIFNVERFRYASNELKRISSLDAAISLVGTARRGPDMVCTMRCVARWKAGYAILLKGIATSGATA